MLIVWPGMLLATGRCFYSNLFIGRPSIQRALRWLCRTEHAQKEYADYFNRSRPHQGIGQRVSAQCGESKPAQSGRITDSPVLAGLHHSDSRVAYRNDVPHLDPLSRHYLQQMVGGVAEVV